MVRTRSAPGRLAPTGRKPSRTRSCCRRGSRRSCRSPRRAASRAGASPLGATSPYAAQTAPHGAAGLCRAGLPAGALSSPFSWLTFYHVSFRFDTAFYGNSTNGAADLKSLIKSPGAVPASLFPRFTNSWGCCSTNQKNRIARSPFPNL